MPPGFCLRPETYKRWACAHALRTRVQRPLGPRGVRRKGWIMRVSAVRRLLETAAKSVRPDSAVPLTELELVALAHGESRAGDTGTTSVPCLPFPGSPAHRRSVRPAPRPRNKTFGDHSHAGGHNINFNVGTPCSQRPV